MKRELETLQRAVGVTRIARITGLDRTGVEVACAIRPGGHVLQVCNGKGETFEAAAIGALMEATELFYAEHPSPGAWVTANVDEVAGACDEVWGAHAVGGAAHLAVPAFADPSIRTGWSFGEDLLSGARVAAPSAALYCVPPGAASPGPAAVSWSSNGMGAHVEREAAVRHALLEAIERDQLARAAPEGWTEALVRGALLPADALAPAVAAWREKLEARAFEVALFDLTPPEGAVGLPVAGALLIDTMEGPIPLTAGYACRATPAEAQLAALLEAAQSRLTDVHGAREDVSPMHGEDVEELRGWVRAAQGRSGARSFRASSKVRPPSVVSLAEQLRAAGHPRLGVFELAPPDAGVHVVKVVVPSFEMTGLL